MATHSSILAWRIPWTEEPLHPQGRKESDMAERLSAHTHSSWISLFIALVCQPPGAGVVLLIPAPSASTPVCT